MVRRLLQLLAGCSTPLRIEMLRATSRQLETQQATLRNQKLAYIEQGQADRWQFLDEEFTTALADLDAAVGASLCHPLTLRF